MKTGFDKYLEERMKDPAFAAGYKLARDEMDMPDIVKAMIAKTNKYLKVLFSFQMAYVNWELDGHGFIVEDENKERFIILTNSGYPYFAKREELVDQINLYQHWIDRTSGALKVFDLGITNDA